MSDRGPAFLGGRLRRRHDSTLGAWPERGTEAAARLGFGYLTVTEMVRESEPYRPGEAL
jgi:hypothetical protein